MGAATGLGTSSSIPFLAPGSTSFGEPQTVQPRCPSASVSASLSSESPASSLAGVKARSLGWSSPSAPAQEQSSPIISYTWPEQESCGQWQASVVLPAASSQYCEQYFFPSVQTQLQAECAHFLASAMDPSEPSVFRQASRLAGCLLSPAHLVRPVCTLRSLRARYPASHNTTIASSILGSHRSCVQSLQRTFRAGYGTFLNLGNQPRCSLIFQRRMRVTS